VPKGAAVVAAVAEACTDGLSLRFVGVNGGLGLGHLSGMTCPFESYRMQLDGCAPSCWRSTVGSAFAAVASAPSRKWLGTERRHRRMPGEDAGSDV